MTTIKPTPNAQAVERALEHWKKDKDYENYRLQEICLEKLFKEFTDNSDRYSVLIKCYFLNKFYSTYIWRIDAVAEKIYKIPNINQRIKGGDVSVIDEIAKVTIGGKTRRNYSFATKFCSFCDIMENGKDRFPIFDSHNQTMLLESNKLDNFFEVKKTNLKDYQTYINVLEAYKAKFGLQKFSAKQIDRYNWVTIKDIKKS